MGIYGYTSGLLTPHHYHLVKQLPNSGFDDKDIFCEDATRVFYINNRENYLIDSESLESIGIDLIYYGGGGNRDRKTFKERNFRTKFWSEPPKTGDFYEDIYIDLTQRKPEWSIKYDILSNTFSFNRDPSNLNESEMEKYISCKLTKQFLQRN